LALVTTEEARVSSALDYEGIAVRVAALLLLLEAVSVWFLWTFSSTGSAGETSFALFLAADLASFAMISYTFRSLKEEGRFGQWPLLAGCAFICALIFAALM
jgi:hypothetical protein